MKNLLPLGSVVRLNKGELKIMIIRRLPLYNNEGTIGYFDYAACVYPTGQADQQVHFFNEEDIAEVFFEGYRDELEEKFYETGVVPVVVLEDAEDAVNDASDERATGGRGCGGNQQPGSCADAVFRFRDLGDFQCTICIFGSIQ